MEQPIKTTRRMDWLFWLIAAGLLIAGLGNRCLWGSEGRWAEITREMLLTKDFFHPTIGGEPYFDKPLLTYWMIVGIGLLTGSLAEWTVRLPSAVFGLVGIGATIWLGRRLWSEQVGRWAGWLMLTSYGILLWSRTAAAETENLAAIMLCIAWYWARKDRPGFYTFVVFYLIAFLGALTKGLTAIVVPILAILPDLFRDKQWKILFKPSHFLALGVGVGVYLAPFFYASLSQPEGYSASGLALVFQENILRFAKPFDHKAPFYIYTYAVPMLVLPWAPLLIAGLAGLLPAWKDLDRKTQWLLAAVAVIFFFFTLSGSRRDYYILPIVPLCCLLMAVFLVHPIPGRASQARRWGMDIQKFVCMGIILFEIALPFLLLFLKFRNHFDFFVSFSISGALVAGAAWLAKLALDRVTLREKELPGEVRPLAGFIATAAVVWVGFFFWQQPVIDRYRTERPFIEEVKAQTGDWPAAQLAFFPKNDAKLLFYLDKSEPAVLLKDASDWDRFLSGPEPKALVTQARYEGRIPPDFRSLIQRRPDIVEKTQPWDSTLSRDEKWAAWFLNSPPVTVSSFSDPEEQTSHAN